MDVKSDFVFVLAMTGGTKLKAGHLCNFAIQMIIFQFHIFWQNNHCPPFLGPQPTTFYPQAESPVKVVVSKRNYGRKFSVCL